MRATRLRSAAFARLIAFAAALIAVPSAASAQLACDPTPERAALSFTGEISGAHAFSQEFGPGWFFELLPTAGGWDMAVIDAAGLDLSQVTPPFDGPNARQIYGWHFRNAANTATNDGSVNAPQHLRVFIFSPSLSGTGGFRPPQGPIAPTPSPDDGRGTLRVLDYGLADLDPGEQSRMVYLSFEVCLNWPANLALDVPPEQAGLTLEDIDMVLACGLPPDLEPVAYLDPPILAGDFDGDGSFDFAMPVVRAGDAKRAIVVCRSGNLLTVIGLDTDLGALTAPYFDSIDRWSIDPPRGDFLTIGKDDSSSVRLFFDGTNFQAIWQGE